MITEENWNYTFYTNENFKSYLSYSAFDCENELKELYLVNITDKNDIDILQKEFSNIKDALQHINQKYASFWSFETMLKDNSSGCSTCVAH